MHINRLFALVATLLAFFLCISTAEAQRPRRVGIVVTIEVNLAPQEAQELAAAMGAAIHKELGVDVISGSESDRRLPEGGVPDECVANSTCRTDLGRRLDADELLLLVIVRMGQDVQIDSTWAHIASGDTASRPKIVLTAEGDRLQAFQEAVPTLLPHIEKPNTEKTNPEFRPEPNIIVIPQQKGASESKDIPTGSWVAGAVSLAALVGGTVFAVSTRQKFDALESDGCRELTCNKSRIETLDRRALSADILLGVSGAAALTAVVLYVIGPSPKAQDEQQPAARVLTGPGTFGFAVGGGF